MAPCRNCFDDSMFEDVYNTLAAHSEGLYKEKGSKFIALAYPVTSEEQVREHLDRIRKEYFDARHHCYAYILGPDKSAFRFNDDGEPSGTAGKPIYGQLLSKDLTDTLVVVVRYFGGVLLGASGLFNAYKTAARDALDNASIVEKTIDARYRITFEYLRMNDVMKILKQYDIPPQNQCFDLNCSLEIQIRQSLSVRVYDALVKIGKVDIL